MDLHEARRAVLAFLDFLKTAPVPPDADAEAISIATDCLSAVYGVDVGDPSDMARFSVDPGLLLRSLGEGLQAAPREPHAAAHTKAGSASHPTLPVAAAGEQAENLADEPRQTSGEGAVANGDVSMEDGGPTRLDTSTRDTSAGDGPRATKENGPQVAVKEAGPSQPANSIPSGEAGAAAGEASSGFDVSAKLEQFLRGLEDANFYAGTEPGSWEYLERQRQAKKVFESSVQNMRNGSAGAGGGSTGAPESGAAEAERAGETRTAGGSDSGGQNGKDKGKQAEGTSSGRAGATGTSSGGDKETAEKLKAQGNAAMSDKRYAEAAALYTRAISLHEGNAIFWANRAAAQLQLGNFAQALADSQQAVQLDPTYSKAYSRLGHAYMGLGQYRDAIEKGFKKALELDSNNASIKEAMKAAKRKLDEQREEQNRQQQRGFSFTFPPGGAFNSPPHSPYQPDVFGHGMPFPFPQPPSFNMHSAPPPFPGAQPGFSMGDSPGHGGASVTMNMPQGGAPPLDPLQLHGRFGMIQNLAGGGGTQQPGAPS